MPTHERKLSPKILDALVADEDAFKKTAHEQLIDLPRGYMSVSQIGLFDSCGERYRRAYIEGQPRKLGSNMIMGSTVDNALERVLVAYRDLGYNPVPDGIIEDAVSAALETHINEIQYYEGRLAQESRPHEAFALEARELVRLFCKERLPQIYPRVMQKRISFSLQGVVKDYDSKGNSEDRVIVVPFLGYADYINRDPELEKGLPQSERHGALDIHSTDCVRDLKTVSKLWHKGRVLDSLQLTLYALGLGLTRTGYDMLVRRQKKESPRFVAQPNTDGYTGVHSKTEGDFAWAVQIVLNTAYLISQGKFPLAQPGAWACNPKWCDYYNACRGRIETSFRVRPEVVTEKLSAQQRKTAALKKKGK